MPEMRRCDREVTDLAEIQAIIEKSMILHLGLFDEEKNQFIFYMHGARQGHKLDWIAQNPKVCIQIEGEVILDYNHEIPCKYGAFFTSFIGRGKAELLDKYDEKHTL